MKTFEKLAWVIIGIIIGFFICRNQNWFGSPIDPSCNCDAKSLPVPVIRVGFPDGLRVYPLDTVYIEFVSALVHVEQVSGPTQLPKALDSLFAGANFTPDAYLDVFSGNKIVWDPESVYKIDVTYTDRAGNQCTVSMREADGIVWTEVNLKPATDVTGNPCNQESACTTVIYSGVPATTHVKEATLPSTPTNFFVNVNGNIVGFKMNGCGGEAFGAVCAGNITTNNVPDINGFITYTSGGTTVFQLKIECKGSKVRITVLCPTACPVTIKSCSA